MPKCGPQQQYYCSAASVEKWNATVEANAQLIRDGCLYMNGSNTYEEHNEKVELLHTSGVESTYALLKKLSNRQMGPELALRLLSFFVIKHNYDCGIKFGQIPSIHNFNILTLLRHTLVTREYIPDFPDTTEYALQIIHRLKQGMGLKNLQPTAILQPKVSYWKVFFRFNEEGLPKDPIGPSDLQQLSLKGMKKKELRAGPLKRLLMAASPAVLHPGRRLTSAEFLNCLGMNFLDVSRSTFSKDEYILLCKVLTQMEGIAWKANVKDQYCPLAAMLLYNAAVTQFQDMVKDVKDHGRILGFKSFSAIKQRVKAYMALIDSSIFVDQTPF